MSISSIKTKKFVLRPLRRSDALDVHMNANDKDISLNTVGIPYPYGIADAKKWIHKTLEKEKRKDKNFLVLAIEIDGKAVGAIELGEMDGHMASVGYWLGKKYWGRGIMTEALKIVTRIGFSKFKLRRIYAYVFTFNDRSTAVLKNVGYELEGLMKKRFRKNGRFLDAYLYAKVR